jgi:hypothetical protein
MFYVWYFDLMVGVGKVLGRPIPVGTQHVLYDFPGIGVKLWEEKLTGLYQTFNRF